MSDMKIPFSKMIGVFILPNSVEVPEALWAKRPLKQRLHKDQQQPSEVVWLWRSHSFTEENPMAASLLQSQPLTG